MVLSSENQGGLLFEVEDFKAASGPHLKVDSYGGVVVSG
jgi:hypothetical protein